VAETTGLLVHEHAEPGVYRVEVHAPHWDVPWVLSNPIVVADEATAARRRARATWPPEPTPPAVAEMIETFEGTSAFQPGSDPTSSIDTQVVEPGAGFSGSAAGRLVFHLAAPSPPKQPHTFCSLVDWRHRSLAGRTGLVFKIRSDRDYRIWVQVRDENPASADEGTEWWFASVRTSPVWRTVALPFTRLRSINPKTDGRLDLDKVRALVFVLDRGAIKTGLQGTIWIDDFGVY
jgi:hypothetical protein